MKIECNLRYSEGFFPTPKSRKLRYREVTTTCSIDVIDIPEKDAHLALRVSSYPYYVPVPYYWYNGSFWKPLFINNLSEEQLKSNLDVCFQDESALRDILGTRYQWMQSVSLGDLDTEIRKLKEYAANYALIAGKLCVEANEPCYELTFSHFEHAFLFIHISDCWPEKASQAENFFDALHFDEMKEKAFSLKDAYGYELGDDFVGASKNYIEVLDESLVTPIIHHPFWIDDAHFKTLNNLRKDLDNNKMPPEDRKKALSLIDELQTVMKKYPDLSVPL